MIEIDDGITIVIRDPRPVEKGYEIWRIDVTFYSMKPEPNKVINNYEIWSTFEYIEDFLHVSQAPSKKQVKNFAREFIRKRYIDSGNNVPDEYGVFCSNIGGEKFFESSGELLSYFEEFKSSGKKDAVSEE